VKKEKKVLIIDCDPQMNLTLLFFKKMNMNYETLKNDNHLDIKGYHEMYSTNTYPINDSLIKVNGTNLWLIRGSIDLFDIEDQLSLAVKRVILNKDQIKNTLWSFRKLFFDMKYNYKENNEKINFDYIILDLNPSSSVLNQILISSIDRLVIPITADIYCNMAIDYISIKMPIWKTILSQDGIVLHNNRNISPNSKIYGFIFNMFFIK